MRLFRKLSFAFALAAVLPIGILASACGGDDNGSNTPTAAASPSASAAAGSPSSAAKAAYPVTVTDLNGRSVEIKAKPKSIVAMSPTATELVYAAGASVVGRTETATYPEAARQAKNIGNAYQPNMETVLSLKPDLLVADSVIDAQPDLKKAIEGAGIPVIYAGADSYQKVIDGLNLMGQVFDSKATTDKVIADINKARDDAKAVIAPKNITAVALIADRDQTLYAAKDSSYVGDIMKQVGINNPASSQPDSGPFPGYTALAPEKLVQFNPDYIFTITPAPAPAPRLSTLIPQIPPFKGLKAVTTQGHVAEIPVELVLQAPGPRIIDAFKAFSAAVSGQATQATPASSATSASGG